jgi:hypothetical protein
MLINKNAALKVSEQGAFDGMELGKTQCEDGLDLEQDLEGFGSVNTTDIENFEIEDVEDSVEALPVAEIAPRKAEQLAAIPEASPAKVASRWSKWRAGDTDQDSSDRATKLKAQRNEGEQACDPLSLNFSDSSVHALDRATKSFTGTLELRREKPCMLGTNPSNQIHLMENEMHSRDYYCNMSHYRKQVHF